MNIIIIGGGSAGTTCAFEIRKLDKNAKITIIEKTSNLEYSPCALPYVLSGEIKTFDDIFIFKREDYANNNIDLMLNSHVEQIDKTNKKIKLNNKQELNYDFLILATGSTSFIPPIKGIETTKFNVLKNIEDAKKIKNETKKTAIIGAGMIGLELAVSLANKNKQISILETQQNILPNLLDEDVAEILNEHLKNNNIKTYMNENIQEIKTNKIITTNNEISFDELIICTGVRANTDLAKNAELETNKGIIVNEHMQTSNKNIFACGDCVESYEFNSNEKIMSQLGTTAVRQAKTIAKNISGQKEKFPQVLNNTISKIGDLYVGAVGINKKRATELNKKIITAKYTSHTRSEYYPSNEKITIKLICDETGILIGGQIIGDSEVIGRLDLIALAIQKKIKTQELANLETCYNPASAPIFDPLTITAEICNKKLKFLR